nr:hypothetical protein CFP56_10203 [Quercus suber]
MPWTIIICIIAVKFISTNNVVTLTRHVRLSQHPNAHRSVFVVRLIPAKILHISTQHSHLLKAKPLVQRQPGRSGFQGHRHAQHIRLLHAPRQQRCSRASSLRLGFHGQKVEHYMSQGRHGLTASSHDISARAYTAETGLTDIRFTPKGLREVHLPLALEKQTHRPVAARRPRRGRRLVRLRDLLCSIRVNVQGERPLRAREDFPRGIVDDLHEPGLRIAETAPFALEPVRLYRGGMALSPEHGRPWVRFEGRDFDGQEGWKVRHEMSQVMAVFKRCALDVHRLPHSVLRCAAMNSFARDDIIVSRARTVRVRFRISLSVLEMNHVPDVSAIGHTGTTSETQLPARNCSRISGPSTRATEKQPDCCLELIIHVFHSFVVFQSHKRRRRLSQRIKNRDLSTPLRPVTALTPSSSGTPPRQRNRNDADVLALRLAEDRGRLLHRRQAHIPQPPLQHRNLINPRNLQAASS